MYTAFCLWYNADMEALTGILGNIGDYYIFISRWILAFLGVFILAKCIKSLIQSKNPSEIWAFLGCPDGSTKPLRHWENVIGRAKSADIQIDLVSISRNHGTLVRDAKGYWIYSDLDSKNGSKINGEPVIEPTRLNVGDTLTLGGADFVLMPVSLEEKKAIVRTRYNRSNPVSPWTLLISITVFQIMAMLQYIVARGTDCPKMVPFSMALLSILMWVYVIVLRSMKRRGFEMELIAFFLSTLSLLVTGSRFPDAVFKQFVAVFFGVALFFALCWYLRDIDRAKKIRMYLVGAGVLLLLVNVVFGTVKYGATNWVSIAGISFQPSELVKIVFIYSGAATLDELFQKKNLTVFMLFSAFCMACLAYLGDFGTAAIFFVTFLIISFLRSGDLSRLILVVGVAVFGGLMLLRFKPYIADRFASWGHVWEDPTGAGFQQTQTMTAVANGGLLGNGAGEGKLSTVIASDTDLVFGVLSEEFGLMIAVLAVASIITLSVFAVKSIVAGRSAFYTIAACSATSMFLFQTILNVFGSIDLIPLTGVTFPFVSNGGTSMLVSWGMLAFLKAADTRQNASLALRLNAKELEVNADEEA